MMVDILPWPPETGLAAARQNPGHHPGIAREILGALEASDVSNLRGDHNGQQEAHAWLDALHARSLGPRALDPEDKPTAMLEQAHAVYREMGNEQRVGEVLNNLGWVVMHDGEFDLARSYHARNIVTARRTRDGSRLSHALGNLGCPRKMR